VLRNLASNAPRVNQSAYFPAAVEELAHRYGVRRCRPTS